MSPNADSSTMRLSKKEIRVAEHYFVEDFRLSDEMESRYEEDPEAVMKELLERHGHTVREINIPGDPEQFTTGEVFCYYHVKSPPDANSYWEPYPCEASGGRISDRLDEIYEKLRATLAVWTSFDTPRDGPRPRPEPNPPD